MLKIILFLISWIFISWGVIYSQTTCPNLATNGDFSAGNSGFTADLTSDCIPLNCASSKYCVATNFKGKCVSWPSVTDHTTGAGNFLIIDGSTGLNNVNVWKNSVSVSNGTTYEFSCWVASVYGLVQQSFDLGMIINGTNVKINTISQSAGTWVQYSFSWTSNVTGIIPIALQQITAGAFRDFGLDDISFSCKSCAANFSYTSVNGCASYQLSNLSTGVNPISVQWSNGAISQSTNVQLSCGSSATYCISITDGNGCQSSICQTLTASDNIPPIAVCAPGIGIDLGTNCSLAVTPAMIDAGSSDNCQIQSITVSPTTLTGCGVFPITMTVTDWCGNKSICKTGIQTAESVPPLMTCPPNMTVNGQFFDGELCAGMVQIGVPTVLDNCGKPVTVTNDYTQASDASGAYPNGSSTVTWTATDACGNTATCSTTVVVLDCPPIIKDTCCAYALHFFNNYADNRIKKVKVSGICDTKICCSDPDFWAENTNYPFSVEFFPADGSGFPLGSVSSPPEAKDVIDNDFEIWLSKSNSNHQLQIDWYDFSNNIVATHTIEIACNGNFLEDEDWTLFTSKTALNDPNLFVFAVREPDDDEEKPCDPDERDLQSDECDIIYAITCNTPNYLINLSTTNVGTSYSWKVRKDEDPAPTPPSITVGTTPNTASFVVPNDGSASGQYIVSLTVSTPSTNSTTIICSGGDIGIKIPKIIPAFTYKLIPCGLTVEFTPSIANFSNYVSSISWSCQEDASFPSSSTPNFPPFTYTFANQSIFHVTMVITDTYGCIHTVMQEVNNNRGCNPNFEIEYDFCSSDCNNQSSISRTVKFKNTSTGGACPVQYTWDFGDGTIQPDNSAIVSHTYSPAYIPCPGGNPSISVKLTMDDTAAPAAPEKCNAAVVTQKTIEISPCNADFIFIKCPDGSVIFTSNVPGEWDFPGSTQVVEEGSDPKDANGFRKKVKVEYTDGTYHVRFIGHCENGGICEVNKYEIKIEIICCVKHSRRHDVHRFTENGRRYKMKYKFAQNQYIGDPSINIGGNSYLLSVHNVKAVTKLRRRNSKFYNFWKNTYDGTLTASFTGSVFTADANCNCNVDNPISETNGPHSLRTKVTAKKSKLGKYHSRKDSITSTHTVTVGAQTFTFNFSLGKDCTPFQKWLDKNF